MSGAFWRGVDWRRPWMAPYADLAPAVLGRLERGAGVAAALGDERFVPQAALPAGEAYESFVHRSGRVPTRDNLHDLMNGLVWLRHPALKRRLNELHAAQIEREGVGATRGPLRDALTLFDENGALLRAPGALVEALRRRDWPTLFVARRALWSQAELQLVGHALLEKLARPRRAITAHVWCLPEGHDPAASIDAASFAAKPFLPLPVLGVPGWWPDNEQAGFYADDSVFRPPRG